MAIATTAAAGAGVAVMVRGGRGRSGGWRTAIDIISLCLFLMIYCSTFCSSHTAHALSQSSLPSSSWADVSADSDFSIANIPLGVFSTPGREPRIASRIGNTVVDLKALQQRGLFEGLGFDSSVLAEPTLNRLMGLTRPAWRAVRARVTDLMRSDGDAALRDNAALRAEALVPIERVTMHMPAHIGDYTDFYSSREHATNVGIMFRGVENALQPNWLHLPVGYHGRASSVVISGTDVVRPRGQLQADKNDPSKGSVYGDCKLFDFELEMAFFVGGPTNPIGRPLTIAEADERIFGLVVMNDWSARDIQAWEYVPLGPFTAKNLATSISAWIVSPDALAPFRCHSSAGPAQSNPEPLPYLIDPNYDTGAFDVRLEVAIRPKNETSPSVISISNLKYMYWNMRQQLVHHSVTGCPMQAGDLLGTGTISGTEQNSFGSMLELSWRGARDVTLTTGGTRKFLQDGDEVIMSGFATSADGSLRVGFGSVSGRVLPAGSMADAPFITATESTTPEAAVVSKPFPKYRLYSYWRSSSSWRVRIALALKGIPYEYVPINLMALVGNNTDRLPAEFRAKNEMEQVPVLEVITTNASGEEESEFLTQSLAIIQYIDEVYPGGAPLLPTDTKQRFHARQIAEIVNSGMQPLQNLTVLRQIKQAEITPEAGGEAKAVDARGFATDKMIKGLVALEQIVSKLSPATGTLFAAGSAHPSIADFSLIPQLYNCRRFNIDLSPYPALLAVEQRCKDIPAFKAADPAAQPDAQSA